MLYKNILRQFWENQQLLSDPKISLPSKNIDEYSEKLVQLIGWGANVRNGAASDNLRRIAINVFPMRYFKVIVALSEPVAIKSLVF